jgi:predicted PurR-regulated permease PerM
MGSSQDVGAIRQSGEALVDKPAEQRVHLHMPVDVRSASLVVIAVLSSLFALHWASAVFIPLLMSILLSYALSPLVTLLCRSGLPRALGAALVVLAILGMLGWTAYRLRDDATNFVDSLPDVATHLRETFLGPKNASPGSLDKVQKAAAQLAQAAAEDASASGSTGKVMRVQVEKPACNIRDYLVVGSMRLAEMAGQFTMVCFITYFLLAAGDDFRRKLARIAGPTFAKRKLTVQALDEIAVQVQRYLLVQVLTSVLVGAATAAAFWMIGLDHVFVWGIVAAVLNLIPYLGSIVLCGVASLVALSQFGSADKAVLVALVTVGLHILSGYLIAPWLTSRTSRLNAVAVFVGVLAWGWLWGVWGLLLGTPILMVVKAVCDRIDDLKGIGELMGQSESSRLGKPAPSAAVKAAAVAVPLDGGIGR